MCLIVFSGFGHELAHHLDAMGFTIFAGCLFAEGKGAEALRTGCSSRLHVLQLDVTSDQQVEDAVKYIDKETSENNAKGPKGQFLRLWALSAQLVLLIMQGFSKGILSGICVSVMFCLHVLGTSWQVEEH